MDQGVSLFIDPTGAETGGRVVKRTFKEIGDAAIGAQKAIDQIANVSREAAKSAEASFRVIAQQQDSLREKYDQVFAAQQRYARALDGINEAQRLGAITGSQRIDLAIRETNSLNAQINTMARLAQTRKEAAQASVDKSTVNPNRGADIAAYGAALDALQAKWDPLFAAQKRYLTNVEAIESANRVGAISGSLMIDLLIKEKAAYEAAATAGERLAAQQKSLAQNIVKVQTISPDRGADIAAYGAQLEALKQKYNPLYAAGQQYRQTVEEIRMAHRVGAISTDEMTAAMARERTAARESIVAIQGQTDAIKRNNAANDAAHKSRLSSLNAGNITAQFQDVGVTAAMGMSPLQIGLQQGTQMALVFEQMKASGGSMAAVLKGAFMQLLGPLSLVTIGVTVGAAALIQYFASVWPKAKTADEAIKQHAESIKAIKDAYGEAAKGLGDYVEKSQAEAAAAARTNLKTQKDLLKELSSEFSSSLETIVGGKSAATRISPKFSAFQDAILQLRRSMKAGEPDFATFRRQVEEAVAADPSKLRVLGDELLTSSEKAGDAGRRVQSAKQMIAGIGDIASQQIAGVSNLKDTLKELSEIALPALTGADKQHQDALVLYRKAAAAATGSEELASARAAYDATLKRIDATNPTVLEDGRKVSVPTPEARPVGLGEEATSKILSFANVDYTTPAKGLTSLSQAVTSVGSAATQSTTSINSMVQAASQSTSGVVDVTRQLADARRAQVTGFEQQGQQLRVYQTQLDEVKKTLEDAANIAPADVFGENIEGGSEAIARAVENVKSLFTELNNGQKSSTAVYAALGRIRAQLIALGGDSKSVNAFMDAIINANITVGNLDSSVKNLSQSIMNIPNRVVSVGIQQYTVGTAGGGTKPVNVYGGSTDYNYQSYDVGGGKSVGVTSFPGSSSNTSSGTTQQQYNVGGKTVTVYGTRAAGGPVEAGKSYLVGEEGPEVVKMAGSGQVSTANSTAALLSGGRDTLSLIEDHLYNVLAELRIHTNYWETLDSDVSGMYDCLKDIKAGIATLSTSMRSSYSSGSSGGSSIGSSKKGGGWSGSSSQQQSGITDYNSPYQGPGITFTNGTGAIGYATYNITPSVLGTQHNPGLRPGPNGYATGGQILPGEDQRVEFFKKNKERVIIVDDNKVSDQRSDGSAAPAAGSGERPVYVNATFHNAQLNDPRARQQTMDDIRRTVQQALRS
jgi:hypothetical protein